MARGCSILGCDNYPTVGIRSMHHRAEDSQAATNHRIVQFPDIRWASDACGYLDS